MIRTKIKQFLPILLLPVICVTLAIFIQSSSSVKAANLSNFNPGRIIDDAVFYNKDAMDVAAIQAFLNSKVPYCDTYTDNHVKAYEAAPCLKDYRETTNTKSANAYCNGYGVLNQSAAEIIYGVAQSCGINPQVIIVTLQKEQGLVTDTWPRDSWLAKVSGVNHQYRSAMGYGCPDTAVCDSTYYGFFNQVYTAAQQFKRYRATPNAYSYVAGRNNNIPWNKDTLNCGYSSVFIENQATAGLYNYTPYRPNQAALNAGYGAGDYCSSHGNRNFYNYFTDWFGSTLASSVSNISLSNGIYNIYVGDLALDIENGSKANIARLTAVQPNNSESQKFKIERQEDNSYKILSIYSGKVVEVHSASNQSGAQIIQYDWHGENNQRWLAVGRSADTVYFINRHSGLALSASSGYIEQQKTASYGHSQAISLSGTMPNISYKNVENGIYRIASKINPNYAFDIYSSKPDNLLQYQLWSKHTEDNQKFSIEKLPDGSHKIISLATGKAMEVQSSNVTDGTFIIQYDWHGEDNQRWLIQDADNGHIRFENKATHKMLDISSRPIGNGAKAVQWRFNDEDSQEFILYQEETFTTKYLDLYSGVYSINSKLNNSMSVDIYSSKPDNLLQYQLWSKHTEDNQKFSIEKLPDGSYKIISLATGKAMDLHSTSPNDGAQIIQYDWHGENNQHWLIQNAGDGCVRFENKVTRKVVDVDGFPSNNGTKLVQRTKNYTSSQKFNLTFIP